MFDTITQMLQKSISKTILSAMRSMSSEVLSNMIYTTVEEWIKHDVKPDFNHESNSHFKII